MKNKSMQINQRDYKCLVEIGEVWGHQSVPETIRFLIAYYKVYGGIKWGMEFFGITDDDLKEYKK